MSKPRNATGAFEASTSPYEKLVLTSKLEEVDDQGQDRMGDETFGLHTCVNCLPDVALIANVCSVPGIKAEIS
jgi:hypothetical protein